MESRLNQPGDPQVVQIRRELPPAVPPTYLNPWASGYKSEPRPDRSTRTERPKRVHVIGGMFANNRGNVVHEDGRVYQIELDQGYLVDRARAVATRERRPYCPMVVRIVCDNVVATDSPTCPGI